MDTQISIPHTIQLSVPVQWGDEKRDSIVINRRLKTKDFKGVSTTPTFDDMIKFISKLSGEPMALIEELDVADMMACMDVVNSFLPGGLKTGENP